MSGSLLDSNVVILQLRREPWAVAHMPRWTEEGGFISVVTRTEVLAGTHPHEEARTSELLLSLTSLPVTAQVADQAGRWIYQYARRGVHLSFPDALIAATAVAYDLTLITTNGKHFPIPELRVDGLT